MFAALGILAVTSQATLISDVEGRLQKRLRERYNQTNQGLFTVAIDFIQVEVRELIGRLWVRFPF